MSSGSELDAETTRGMVQRKPKPPPVKPKPTAAAIRGAEIFQLQPQPSDNIVDSSNEAQCPSNTDRAKSRLPALPKKPQLPMPAPTPANISKILEQLTRSSGFEDQENVPEKRHWEPAEKENPPPVPLPIPKARRKHGLRVAGQEIDQGSGQLTIGPERGHREGQPTNKQSRCGQNSEAERRVEEVQNPEGRTGGKGGDSLCLSDCPCVCHRHRPGMVLVWMPASAPPPHHPPQSHSSDTSLSDLSETEADGEDKPFRYVLQINGESGETDTDTNGHACEGANTPSYRVDVEVQGEELREPPGRDIQQVTAEETKGENNCDHDVCDQTTGGDDGVTLVSYQCVKGFQPPHHQVTEPQTNIIPDKQTLIGSEIPANEDPKLLPLNLLPKPAINPVPKPSINPVPKPPRRNRGASRASFGKIDVPLAPTRPRKAPRPVSQPPHLTYFLPQAPRPAERVNPEMELPNQRLEVTEPSCRPRVCHPRCPNPTETRSAPSSPKEPHQHRMYSDINIEEVGDLRSEDDLYEFQLEVPESRPSKDQKLINWQSQFESEPLYQTYRETIITKEIRRQTLVRASSKTSSDCVYESIVSIRKEVSSSSRGSNPQTPRNTLWQNLPVVRESGILEEMSREECKLQESMFEVLTSEASYLKSLNLLIDHFEYSKELQETIILRDKRILFSNINRVKDVSESFLQELVARVYESVRIFDVCDIIHRHAEDSFHVYIDYVRNQLYQEQKYSHLMESNSHFAAVIVRLQEMPDCQRLPFMSFLLLPFQRITRIKMLIENILQRTEVGSTNEDNATKALDVVSKIIEECNTEVGKMKQMEELIDIGKKLEFDKLKAIPIISQARHLDKKGEITEIIQRGNLFVMKPKMVPLYLFLFNDLLLITSRKSSDRYLVVDHAHRSMVEVQSYGPQSSERENCFLLTLLENHQGRQAERLVKPHSQSDLHRWLDALSSHNRRNSESSSDEKIYERWDCPQVQCLVPYTAQQADELSLEPADIVNVTRKSSEGWYEGTKLSTGQKGWFPSKQVQEITDEHVRRRNLRERYRVLKAAQELQLRYLAKGKKRNVVSL